MNLEENVIKIYIWTIFINLETKNVNINMSIIVENLYLLKFD